MFDLNQKYPYFEEVNTPLLRLLPSTDSVNHENRPKKILDVGCGRAALGAELIKRGYEVWGVESSGEVSDTAQERLSKLIQADLTQYPEVLGLIGDTHFDYIIFSDVLEHVYDPLEVLRVYSKVLKPQGNILISLPNVANWETRLKLLFGRFNYEQSGVMDKTHIRFFTFSTAKTLVKEAGLKTNLVDCDPYLIRAFLPAIRFFCTFLFSGADSQGARSDSILNSPLYRFYMRWLYPFEYHLSRAWKSLLGFRIILVAEKGIVG